MKYTVSELVHFLYPLTVVNDRYSGTYSGAGWIAWKLHPNEVSPLSYGEDIPCMKFWEMNPVCGRGNTPQEAIDNLALVLEPILSARKEKNDKLLGEVFGAD